MPRLAKLFRKLRKKGDVSSVKSADSRSESSQENTGFVKPKTGQSDAGDSIETDATSLSSQHVLHTEKSVEQEGREDWGVSPFDRPEVQKPMREPALALQPWKCLTLSSESSESEEQKQLDIAMVVTMLELGTSPAELKLFSPRQINRVQSTSAFEDGLRNIDSFIELCDSRDHVRKSHSYNEVDRPSEKQKAGKDCTKKTELACENLPSTDRPSNKHQENCLETREDTEDSTSIRRLLEKAKGRKKSTMYSIKEDEQSKVENFEKSTQLCHPVHTANVTHLTAQRRILRRGSKSSMESSQPKAILQTTSMDSWGRVNFQNLHPIARLRYQHLQSEDSLPCYY